MRNVKFIFATCVILACNSKNHPPSLADKNTILSLKQTADILYDQNEYETAAKYLDTLIAIDSLNGEYYFKRGYCNAMLFKYYLSTNDYNKAASLNYRKSSAYFNMGLNYSLVNDSIAILYFEKCYETDSTQIKAKEKIRELKEKLTPSERQQYDIMADSVLFRSI
ncbi:tetratricopeptide repeat protein [Chitinophaga nivalis]|uniref:Tetratricopeptide repeat protein n=1 Tax=Chitinophaga nivalis TaxID=2991709 RepID=A0ABT3IEH5_9BACT|nr:hypothetical protein [Chitinophaga nivalis]MCW3467942.1 hypothetical protein [Chitinophaga nivalis]MCW3482367.1 hypothetical protein [Chitinophaga nivalis]